MKGKRFLKVDFSHFWCISLRVSRDNDEIITLDTMKKKDNDRIKEPSTPLSYYLGKTRASKDTLPNPASSSKLNPSQSSSSLSSSKHSISFGSLPLHSLPSSMDSPFGSLSIVDSSSQAMSPQHSQQQPHALHIVLSSTSMQSSSNGDAPRRHTAIVILPDEGDDASSATLDDSSQEDNVNGAHIPLSTSNNSISTLSAGENSTSTMSTAVSVPYVGCIGEDDNEISAKSKRSSKALLQRRLSDVYEGHHVKLDKLQKQMEGSGEDLLCAFVQQARAQQESVIQQQQEQQHLLEQQTKKAGVEEKQHDEVEEKQHDGDIAALPAEKDADSSLQSSKSLHSSFSLSTSSVSLQQQQQQANIFDDGSIREELKALPRIRTRTNEIASLVSY